MLCNEAIHPGNDNWPNEFELPPYIETFQDLTQIIEAGPGSGLEKGSFENPNFGRLIP
jgi:hypothetical protein